MSSGVPDNFFKNCIAIMNNGHNLTDWRSATEREQQNRKINGIYNNDSLREFYQQNGKAVMDAEWNYLKTNTQCNSNVCVHKNPTLSSNKLDIDEIKAYNAVSMGYLTNYNTSCKLMKDYRASN